MNASDSLKLLLLLLLMLLLLLLVPARGNNVMESSSAREIPASPSRLSRKFSSCCQNLHNYFFSISFAERK
jgi:hypothetical protein